VDQRGLRWSPWNNLNTRRRVSCDRATTLAAFTSVFAPDFELRRLLSRREIVGFPASTLAGWSVGECSFDAQIDPSTSPVGPQFTSPFHVDVYLRLNDFPGQHGISI